MTFTAESAVFASSTANATASFAYGTGFLDRRSGGALGWHSPLRWAVSQAARRKAGAAELEAGCSVTLLGKVARAARNAVRASARAWAACLKKVLSVSPVLCVKCGGAMEFPLWKFPSRASSGSGPCLAPNL